MNGELLRQLYNKYRNEIYLYLYSMCKNSSIADDLTQETFLKALLSLGESHGNMKAWLYMVARNLYFNYQKKQKSVVSWDEAQFKEDTGGDSLLSQIIQTEKNELLFKGLSQLGANKREILQLQYFGGLSQNEIAAILKLTPANVRVLALRGKRELKQYLEANGYEIS